tara:strand:+ start:243337 stop:243729 length:393 start_codon:yes stop_codon:yes gene_type:complete
MKFRYAILYVNDVAATIDFYGRAFGLEKSFIHESGDYGEVATGTTTLSFSAHSLMRQLGKNSTPADPAAPVFEIALETDDVSAALSRAVDAGATLVQEAKEMPWGQTTAYVNDINGFLVEICTPVQTQQI